MMFAHLIKKNRVMILIDKSNKIIFHLVFLVGQATNIGIFCNQICDFII